MHYAIETNSLVKIYSGKKVIDEVSMHIPEGSIYGFVGENGSGKTTIMRLLMGLANPTKGTYSLFGVDRKDNKIYTIRKNVSAIVETPSIVTSMTAYQNLEYACHYFGIKNYKEVIPSLLEQVGLADVGKKKAGNFSLGMRQRLGIALLLLNKPRLILLDEPMNGLDPTGVAELRDIIINLNKQGITFLISSHILSELEKVATHWGFISHGKIIKELSNEDLGLECKKSTDLAYHDLDKLEEALKDIGIKELLRSPNHIRIFDDILPIDILTKLSKKGIEIKTIRTNDVNVEEYYLSLVGGARHV
ncbi:MAG: ATP-binding cassette domain-containing protein [Bacilli bacterium]|nr:ATP-binding cassette domain-containing protein [Bacilli bacterium]